MDTTSVGILPHSRYIFVPKSGVWARSQYKPHGTPATYSVGSQRHSVLHDQCQRPTEDRSHTFTCWLGLSDAQSFSLSVPWPCLDASPSGNTSLRPIHICHCENLVIFQLLSLTSCSLPCNCMQTATVRPLGLAPVSKQ
jgi:hypothetical protein